MRQTLLLASLAAPNVFAQLAALAAPDVFAPFEPAVSQLTDALFSDNSNDLVARQNNACATNYYACAALNAPGLCCPSTAICSADINRVVGCCAQGSRCTGTLGAPNLSATSTPTTTTSPFVLASPTPTTNTPFVQSPPTGGAPSTVQNAFFPFVYIPTTYANAAACSSAYTGCQSAAASCTTALANGAMGVAISAPNGGATITAVPSVGLQSAQSICASLSAQACYGLQVEACRSFGGVVGRAAPTRGGCVGAVVGAGIVVAGQMLR
jgi:hypothetical protein